MKIKSITIHNYKKFVNEKTISFCNEDGEINNLTLIVGNNGTGKSSILQAIVALIAPLTRDKFTVFDIDWGGFEYRFLQSGRFPLHMRAEIEFSEQELKQTVDFAERLKKLGIKLGTPNQTKSVTVQFNYDQQKPIVKGNNAKNYYQFSGYQYAKRLTAYETEKVKLFENVGNIYWYTEQRTSYNTNEVFEVQNSQLDSIRSYLANAYSFHLAISEGKRELQIGEFDFYERLAVLYSTVFTDRKFVGSAPRFDIFEKSSAPDFFLSDGHNQYELSEMSAGERAIFPILMDFARYNINNSIVIIDEIELHLHAPLQQAFIRSLLKLGYNNQFIVTTHSDTVANMFDETKNQIIRLK